MPWDRSGAANLNWRGGKSSKGSCSICGGPTWVRSVTRCKKCYSEALRLRVGSANPEWGKFSSTQTSQGHDRAKRRFKLGPCQRCGKPGKHRHHRDRNPLNNTPSNIEILCFSCHQLEHNRQ